ncbi:MAG: hypothetical protein JG765_1704 [Cereibacter sp.]|jgi:hypothetical protein|nr:hypothetical protein [Cereibacter sp.]
MTAPTTDKTVSDLAQRHEVSEDAVRTLLAALRAGNGRQAQFSHPELGGMGQWSAGGMVMVGDMFDASMKKKVDALCTDLAKRMSDGDLPDEPKQAAGQGASAGDKPWPEELGRPSSTGSQNGMRYAVFPESRRLAIDTDGRIEIYDTGDHRIGGAAQQQGGGSSLAFSSQNGPVRLLELRRLD